MKKIILLLTLTTIMSISSNAQTFEPNFLGRDFQFYKGVLLKLKNDAYFNDITFSCRFYRDLKFLQSVYERNGIYLERIYVSQ